MTIAHHPTDPTLAAFAAGALDEGRALVVSTHLITCPDCRRAVRSFEQLRGIALEDAVPVHLEEEALQRALQQISSGETVEAAPLDRDPSGRGRLRYRRIRLAIGAGSRSRIAMASRGSAGAGTHARFHAQSGAWHQNSASCTCRPGMDLRAAGSV